MNNVLVHYGVKGVKWGVGLMRYLELIGPDEYPEQLLTTRAAVRQALLNEIHRRNALDDISHNVERRHVW